MLSSHRQMDLQSSIYARVSSQAEWSSFVSGSRNSGYASPRPGWQGPGNKRTEEELVCRTQSRNRPADFLNLEDQNPPYGAGGGLSQDKLTRLNYFESRGQDARHAAMPTRLCLIGHLCWLAQEVGSVLLWGLFQRSPVPCPHLNPPENRIRPVGRALKKWPHCCIASTTNGLTSGSERPQHSYLICKIRPAKPAKASSGTRPIRTTDQQKQLQKGSAFPPSKT